jgi:hypothetical protein
LTERDLVRAADANYYESWRALSRGHEAFVHEADGILITAPSKSLAWMNVVFVTKALRNAEAQLSSGFDMLRERKLPFFVHMRADMDAAAERACERLGCREHDSVPGLAMAPIARGAKETDLEIHEVQDDASFAELATVVGQSFDIPLHEALAGMTGLRSHPNARCWLGYAGGRAVACSALIVIDSIAGVNVIGTLAGCRGRGYGEAMTWQTVNAGIDAGCSIAVLQASDMGRPIYERMGFRTVTTYKTYIFADA